jgi:flagellar assembly protein FliH
MDALIRSAPVAASRTRLSEARPATSVPPLDALRAQIEQEVRAESAARLRELYESEHSRARAEGQRAAVTDAREAAATEFKKACEALTRDADRAVAALEQAHREALARLDASVGEVAFAALCRLIGPRLSARDFVLDQIARTCLELRADLTATVKLHPRDIEMLRDLLPNAQLRIGALALDVVADESLALGGCVAEAASGHYDGGLENQLRRLHAALTTQTVEG